MRAAVKHTPTKANDCANVVFEFDGSKLKQRTKLVVFEDLYQDGILVSTHSDINDEGQTTEIPPPPGTPPSLAKTGATVGILAAGAATILGGGIALTMIKRRATSK